MSNTKPFQMNRSLRRSRSYPRNYDYHNDTYRSLSSSPPRIHNTTVTSQQTTTDNDNSAYQILEDQMIAMTISNFDFTLECAVCMVDKSFHEFEGIFGDTCVHIERTVCNSCVYESTKCQVKDAMIYFGDVTCPEDGCHGIFDYNGIQQILLFIGNDKELFDQYDQHIIFLQLQQMPDFLWCAYNCGSGQIYDVTNANPAVTCMKCNRSTCSKHRSVWHTDMSCDQYDVLISQSTDIDVNDKWLQLFSKECPQCHFHIQKIEGCDHMTCRYCKHEFCWECFVDYKQISDKGASEHISTCSHFQPNSSQTTE